jgi:hypothetical protein
MTLVAFPPQKRVTTEDVANHDACERLCTWSREYFYPRVPLAQALHQSLRVGLISGDPCQAKNALLATAANPGLDIEAYNVFDLAMHHAALIETVCAYLTAEGLWTPCGVVSCDGFEFEPLSYLLPDGRLRRVVLCSTWNVLREQEEKTSWWTVADTLATGRPMLLNVIVIGQARKGFRVSPWTTGYIHPENRILRVKKREGKFTDNWKRVYREQTDHKAEDWLTIMQQDQAFDDLVLSCNAEPGRGDLGKIAREIFARGTEMRRSACFRLAPCPMARVCHHTQEITPDEARWKRRDDMAVARDRIVATTGF